MEILKNEYLIIEKLYYKIKSQFRSSILLNRLNELRRNLKRFLDYNTNESIFKIQNCCMNLYVAASNFYKMGHFIKMCLVLFGISGRVYGRIRNVRVKDDDEISDLFDGLDD